MLSEETKQTLILSLLGVGEEKKSSGNINDSMIGRKVMVRTYSAGVHFGTLSEKVGQEAILKDSRRVFYWSGAASLSQLAMEGSKNISDCKIAMVVSELLLNRVIEIIPMAGAAIENLYGCKEWKQ